MKARLSRILALLLVLVLAGALAGCAKTPETPAPAPTDSVVLPADGGKASSGSGSSTTKPAAEPVSGDLTMAALIFYMQTGDTLYYTPRVLTATEREALRRHVERYGATVTFSGDGTLTVRSRTTDSWFRITPQGETSGEDPDGSLYIGVMPEDENGNIQPETDPSLALPGAAAPAL